MMTYVVLLVRRGKDDRERRMTVYVRGQGARLCSLQQAVNSVERRTTSTRSNPNPDLLGWRVVRVSEGGYH